MVPIYDIFGFFAIMILTANTDKVPPKLPAHSAHDRFFFSQYIDKNELIYIKNSSTEVLVGGAELFLRKFQFFPLCQGFLLPGFTHQDNGISQVGCPRHELRAQESRVDKAGILCKLRRKATHAAFGEANQGRCNSIVSTQQLYCFCLIRRNPSLHGYVARQCINPRYQIARFTVQARQDPRRFFDGCHIHVAARSALLPTERG